MSASRFLLTWLAMAAAMTANGVLRELALVRVMTRADAAVLSAGLGALIILAITRSGFAPLAGSSVSTLLGASAALLGLTVAFECAIGRWVDHKSWSELAANYAFWRGSLWPLVLLLVALTPFIWGRWIHAWRHSVAGA